MFNDTMGVSIHDKCRSEFNEGQNSRFTLHMYVQLQSYGWRIFQIECYICFQQFSLFAHKKQYYYNCNRCIIKSYFALLKS
jgi:2C-methyl-D-erythritol 2,4-cyclodiphosphate synthase